MHEIYFVYFLGLCTVAIFGIVVRMLLAQPGWAPKLGFLTANGLAVAQCFVVVSGSERHAAALLVVMIALGLWFSPTTGRESLPYD